MAIVREILFFIGFASIVYGIYRLSEPFSFIIGGALLMAIVIVSSGKRGLTGKNRKDRG